MTNFILLRETGTISSDHVEISFNTTISSGTILPQEMAKWLEVTSLQYCDIDLRDELLEVPEWDVNSNNLLDLDDIERSVLLNAAGGPMDNLPTPEDVGGLANMHMTIKFNSGATDDVQGATLILSITFTINQSNSQ